MAVKRAGPRSKYGVSKTTPPVFGVYTTQIGKTPVRIFKFEFSEREVKITDTAKPAHVEVVILDEDKKYFLSEFNPANLPDLGADSVEVMLLSAEQQVPMPYKVRFAGMLHTERDGVRIQSVKRFELASPGGSASVFTFLDGQFQYTENSKWQRMHLVDLTADEMSRAEAVLRRVT
jgi:hypothetical protein